MRPSAAEVARTLARGRLKGTVRFADGGSATAFHHATDRTGRPLLLSNHDDELAAALRKRSNAPEVRLAVDDVPPLPGAPSLGSVRLSGTLRKVPRPVTKTAVLEFAQSNPVADLFDVGDGAAMHLIEVRRVSLDRLGATEPIDPAAYAAVEPDPLHECERDLLEDLADHHGAQLDHIVRHLLDDAGAPKELTPRVVRLDRYGFVIDLGADSAIPKRGRWVRL